MTDTPLERLDIYTDGACLRNPGPGGWGALLLFADAEKELYGGVAETTNNRMEIMGAIQALQSLPYMPRRYNVNVFTDSTYLRDGITKWIHGWRRNGWKNSERKPVKNKELWQKLEVLAEHHQVSWHWVKAHNGHPENERADALANRGLAPYR